MSFLDTLKTKKYITADDIREFADSENNVLPRFSQGALYILRGDIKRIRAAGMTKGYSDSFLLERRLDAAENTWLNYLTQLRIALVETSSISAKFLLPFIIPFDELPLHVNDEDYLTRIIVPWRLTVGE